TWASPQTVGYTLEVEKILCPSPYGLGATDITEDSAVLEWSGSGVFDIEYGMTGFTPTQNPTNASTTGVTSPFTLTDLTPGTTYQYYVRQDCGVDDGFSDWVGPFTFTTLCATLTPPTATQSFTGYTGAAPATLACWSEAIGSLDSALTGTTSSWMNQAYNYNYDTTGGVNGTAAYINLYGTDNEWIISPPVDLGDGSTLYQLEYDVSITPWTGTSTLTSMGEKFVKVVVSTDGGATWSSANVIQTYDNNNIPGDGGLTEYIPLVGYSGVVKFGFYAHSTSTTNDSRFYIDNWRVIVAPDCAVPTGVTSSNVTFSTADLSWVGTGESFDIEYGVAGFTPSGTPNVSGVTTTNYTLGSGVGEELVSGTTYHYYVRQYCNTDDGYSSWVGPFVFSVPMLGEDCGAPIVIDALPYTVTDDTANYGDNPAIEGTPGASGCGSTSSYLNGNDVVYSYTADFDGSVKVSLTPTGNYAGIFAYDSCQNIGVNCIGGAVAGFSTNEIGFELPVEEGETYYLVISTWASPQTVGYTLEVEKILCPSPYGLGATDITEDSAVLEWSGSGVFDIEYGMTGFTPTQNP